MTWDKAAEPRTAVAELWRRTKDAEQKHHAIRTDPAEVRKLLERIDLLETVLAGLVLNADVTISGPSGYLLQALDALSHD